MKLSLSCMFLCMSFAVSGLKPTFAQIPLPDRFFISDRPYSAVRQYWSKETTEEIDQAMEQYSNISECIQTIHKADQIKVRWFRVRRNWPFNICIFLIAEQLETPQAMVEFLESEGLKVVLQDTRKRKSSNRSFLIQAYHDLGLFKSWRVFRGGRYILARLFRRSANISISYHKYGPVKSVQAGVNWN